MKSIKDAKYLFFKITNINKKFMNIIKKKELHFIILIIISFILYYLFPNKFWNYLLVPSATNDFVDFRCVASWSRLYEDIYNSSIIYNNNGIGECRLNYPKIWVLISSFFKLGDNNFLYTYVSVFVILYISIFYKLIKKHSSYFLIYLFFSGASLLLIERGNVDIVIFILLYYLMNVENSIFRYLLFILSVILKIFPVFGILGLLKKNNYYSLIFILTTCFVYFLVFADDFYMISKNTPQTGDMSYGTLAIVKNLDKHFNIYFNHFYLSLVLIVFSIIVYILLNKEILKIKNQSEIRYYFLGAGIFIISFLINSNFDYRLIFLFFTVPLILNLENKLFKVLVLVSLFLSLELHRLIYFFGFFGGVLNSTAKIILFISYAIICLNIIEKNIKIKKLLKTK